MSSVLQVDFETRSVVDLKKAGVYVYAAHPLTDVLCMAYAFDDEEPELWYPGLVDYSNAHYRAFDHILARLPMRAWNAQFERTIWREILGPRYGFPVPKPEQWFCTAADAAALSLPRSLELAGQALGLAAQKDVEGSKVMMKLCKPRKARKGEDRERTYWHEDPADFETLYSYCKQDVRSERAIANVIKPLTPRERQLYLLDQRMNDRGVLIDLELVGAAQEIVAEGTKRANARVEELTGASVTQVAKLREWCGQNGLDIENLRKDTLRDVLGGDGLTEIVREVLTIRSEAAKTSVAKLESMVACAGTDHRARGLLLFLAAGTGRWGGRLIQPQNFPRPTVGCSSECATSWGSPCDCGKVARFIERVLARDFEGIEHEEPALVVISSLLRSMLRAAPGHVFRSGDFSQIEARVLAWIAGQDDLVEAFRSGAKIYEDMAAFIYDLEVADIGKESHERQVGKNTVLGAGFQMGDVTFRTQIKVQAGVDVSEDESERAILGYRERYPRIPEFWRSTNTAAIRATEEPGSVHSCGRNNSVKFTRRGQFLWMILPSGRALAYARPRVKEILVQPRRGEPFMATSVTFMHTNLVTKKWERRAGYGGLWTNNVVQATARDLMAAAMMRLEHAGYRPILTVHDEVLSEPEVGHGSLGEYRDLMKVVPAWAEGLPVACDAWEGERYRK